jgi:hypothetical protein
MNQTTHQFCRGWRPLLAATHGISFEEMGETAR